MLRVAVGVKLGVGEGPAVLVPVAEKVMVMLRVAVGVKLGVAVGPAVWVRVLV